MTIPTIFVSSAGHHAHRLLLWRFSSFAVWALLCSMVSRTAHEASLVLLVLLLLEGSGLLRLIVLALALATIAIVM